MANAVILALLAAVLIIGVRSYMKKLAHGCCGGGDGGAERKVRVSDRNPAHYAHAVRLSIAGMTCSRCAGRVENALNGLDGVWARVDLKGESALVRMKARIPDSELERVVAQAGYAVTAIARA